MCSASFVPGTMEYPCMAVALLSDYCAGAFAVAIVYNSVGWFFGGAALMVAGSYVIGRSKSKKR